MKWPQIDPKPIENTKHKQITKRGPIFNHFSHGPIP